MSNFNFDYNGKKHPNYRVEYEKEGGASVSSPAIFKNNKEAIAAALEEFPEWIKIGMNVVKVLKYKRSGLEEVFSKSI